MENFIKEKLYYIVMVNLKKKLKKSLIFHGLYEKNELFITQVYIDGILIDDIYTSDVCKLYKFNYKHL